MTGSPLLDRGQLVSLKLAGGTDASASVISQLGLVLSGHDYHLTTRNVLVALVTDQPTGYPFAVSLPEGFSGRIVLSDQVRTCSLDRYEVTVVETISPKVVHQVLGKLEAILRI